MKLLAGRLPIIAFAALGVIWGSNFIYMKLAAEQISPLQIVFFRVLFGFLPVLLFALLRRALNLNQLRHAGHFLVMSLLATSVYYFGFAKGTSLLLSGVAGAVSGAIPLFAFPLAVLFIPEEKASPLKIVGVLVGFIGVLIMARPSGSELAASNFEGVAWIVLGALTLGASFIYARRFVIPLQLPAAALTTWQLGFGLLTLLLVTPFDGLENIFAAPHAALGLVVGLGLLGTGLAYIIYYYIVDTLGAVSASSVTYIPPVVALLIGALIAGEPIGLLDWLATGMIFVGVVLLKKKSVVATKAPGTPRQPGEKNLTVSH